MLSLNTKVLLLSFSTLAVVHVIALQYELYWVVSWFDIPMHFFGGVIVALGLYTLADIHLPIPRTLYQFRYFMVAVILVAIAWEVFEYRVSSTIPPNYTIDTVTDLILGMLGGGVGFIIGKRFRNLDTL